MQRSQALRLTALAPFLFCGWGIAQRPKAPAPPPRRPAADATTVLKSDCPAAVPPATSGSVAAATDFIELQRTACFGACPAYTVRVWGDGRIAWHGERFVEVTGDASASVESNDARALLQRFADRGFWALCGRYSRPITDNPTYFTTLSVAGHSKKVEDYASSAPSWLRAMDEDIDRVAHTHRWRHGAPATETFGDDRLRVDVSMPKTGVTRLMKSAALPDTKDMEDWLKTLPDVNARDGSGWTALMYAAQAGPLQAVSTLLRAGADPLARSGEGETALSAAVSSTGDAIAKIQTLAAAGLDVNSRDNRGVSALMLACRLYWRPRLVATLLDLGADPAKRDADGRRAVDYLDARYRESADPSYAAIRALLTR